ncbi:DUF2179 domain-containing protein [Desulfoprunum benzoelyticum]|uniref:Uncharacterized protein YebE (UPF0316 family) n=1 Tax=Desulfoprunum benzoelyticum TaxID=1506996 RepID=A0A840UK09_9BACT|nr:DUF5698 domain-containing protein [Desulfoprunum benzoelyticum]MBB5346677.1 uncharacterized protein YebE (UPF0316 family) [Desulfoprunum benzoelyticum]MBM9529078.1 DUF2179 domain-containing protein [Desulfoprunum benzoelyticum]
MTESNIIIALTIFIARVCDVGLGTIRHALIIRGRKSYVFIIAFFEAIIWVYAVSRVLSSIQDPLTSIAFATGFATGTFVGMTIENLLKIGEQVIRIFSRSGHLVAQRFREKDYRVTVFDGNGRDGVVQLLFVQVKRREVSRAMGIARHADPHCLIIIDDIRSVHMAKSSGESGTDLLSVPPLVSPDNK